MIERRERWLDGGRQPPERRTGDAIQAKAAHAGRAHRARDSLEPAAASAFLRHPGECRMHADEGDRDQRRVPGMPNEPYAPIWPIQLSQDLT